MEPKEKLFERTWVALICISAAYIAGGILLLLFPQVSLPALCQAVGILLVMIGIVLIASYFLRKRYLEPGHFEFAGGAACILLGIFSLICTQQVAFAFSQILALLVLGDSLVKLQYSTDLLRLRERRWWMVLVAALFASVLSMVALANPFGTDGLRLHFTYGVLIADGVLNISVVLFLRHAHRIFTKRADRPDLEDTADWNPQEYGPY